MFQVPEQPEYGSAEERVTCVQNTTDRCEKVPKKVCHTQIKTEEVTYTEAEENCVKVPHEVRTYLVTLNVPGHIYQVVTTK